MKFIRPTNLEEAANAAVKGMVPASLFIEAGFMKWGDIDRSKELWLLPCGWFTELPNIRFVDIFGCAVWNPTQDNRNREARYGVLAFGLVRLKHPPIAPSGENS